MKAHVMHVPGVDIRRDNVVTRLRGRLDVCVHEDPLRQGVVTNWLSALDCASRTDGDQEWSIILQDDVIPYPDTFEVLPEVLKYSPSPLVSLVCNGLATNIAFESGHPYAVGNFILYGPAVGYRRDIVQPLFEWATEIVAEASDYPYDDMLACLFVQTELHVKPAVVSRSLFDLLPVKSLLGHARHKGPTYPLDGPGPEWSLGTAKSISRSDPLLPARFQETRGHA